MDYSSSLLRMVLIFFFKERANITCRTSVAAFFKYSDFYSFDRWFRERSRMSGFTFTFYRMRSDSAGFRDYVRDFEMLMLLFSSSGLVL